jgi:Spy/CpxP family protein refolding chaperone
MKKLLNIIVAASVMAALTATSFAQGAGPAGGGKGAPGQGQQGKGPGGRRGGLGSMDAEILAKMNLTTAQKDAIKKLKEETQKKVQDLMKDSKGDREGMREKFKPIMEGYQAGMKKILGAKYPEYEKAMKEMRKKFQNRGPGGPAGGPPPAGKGKGKGGGN